MNNKNKTAKIVEEDHPIEQINAHIKPDTKSAELMVGSQPDQQSNISDSTQDNNNNNNKLGSKKNTSMPYLSSSPPGFDSKSMQNEPSGGENSHFKRNNQLTRSANSYDYNNLKKAASQRNAANLRSNRSIPAYSTKQLHLIYSQYKQERQEKMGVPMLTTLMIIPLYLACGMLIFSSFEQWSKLDALYFCFITLTTIGFGDIMPGSTFNINKSGNKNNLYISALYIFIGLILIAMCINLVKNQFKYKLNKLARKFGLSSSSDH